MRRRDEALLERNLAAIKEYFPQLYHRMVSVRSASQIVGGDGERDLNMDLGHTLFYEGGAETYLEEQWERYVKRPDRITLSLPSEPLPGDKETQRIPYILQQGIFKHFRSAQIADVHRMPQEQAGFMIVFGVGLGLHIDRLIETFKFRHLIIVEQFPEFIYHSLHFVDWTKVFDKVQENRGKVNFFLGDNADEISQIIHYHLRATDFGIIDGSYIYRHYSSPFLDATFSNYVKSLPLQLVSKGFFEDEIIMMRNTFQNLMRYDFDLLEPVSRLLKETPALIVGSGPSIDRSLDLLRRLREQEKVVVFSCGTTLRVLLRNGIVPHFHCELENVPAVHEHLEPLSREYDFSGITLIATTTVDPRVPGMFGKRLLYFRDALTSTTLFGNPAMALFGGAPNVSNLGTRVAIVLGFRRIYFLGVDLGTRSKTSHHAKDAVYNKEWEKTYTRLIEPMDIELPANFGGKAYTNRVLLWGRSMLQSLLVTYGDHEYYNCSDGVRIQGAAPMLPARLAQFEKSPGSNIADIAQIGLEVSACRPRDRIKRERIVEASENFAVWHEELKETLTAARDEAWSFLKLYDNISELISRRREAPDAVLISGVVLGSTMMMLQFAYFYAHRLDPDLQTGFMAELLDRLDEAFDKMVRLTRELFDQFIEEIDREATPA